MGGLMPGSRPSFNKRQKEKARQETAPEKAQKRAEPKGQREAAPQERAEKAKLEFDDEGNPNPLDVHDFPGPRTRHPHAPNPRRSRHGSSPRPDPTPL